MDFLKDVLSSILSLGGIFTLFYIGGYCIELGKTKVRKSKDTSKRFCVSYNFLTERGTGFGCQEFVVTGNNPLVNVKLAKETIQKSLKEKNINLKENTEIIILSVSEVFLDE